MCLQELRSIVNGSHSDADLQNLVHKFVDIFVLCPTCTYPETKLKISTKNKTIMHVCKACGEKHMVHFLERRHHITPQTIRIHKLSTMVFLNLMQISNIYSKLVRARTEDNRTIQLQKKHVVPRWTWPTGFARSLSKKRREKKNWARMEKRKGIKRRRKTKGCVQVCVCEYSGSGFNANRIERMMQESSNWTFILSSISFTHTHIPPSF